MTTEEYREKGFELFQSEEYEKAFDCFNKAVKKKDIPSAVALAVYYYEQKEDDDTAKEWLEKAFEWDDEAGEPEEFDNYVGLGYYLRGLINKEQAPYLAVIDFYAAYNRNNYDGLADLGELIYEGYDSPTGEQDVETALSFWKEGMELGDEKCAQLYKEHEIESLPDGVKTIKFKNGDVYKGEVNNDGQPHGKGHMKYKLNGYYGDYNGEWYNGKRHGNGKYEQYSNGGGARHSYRYTGEWRDDKENGQGVSIHSDEKGIHLSTVNSEFTGEFKDGKPNGHGVLLEDSFDGSFSGAPDRYEGEFKDGYLNGHGTCQYANGDYYEGDFKNGNKHGQGIYTYVNGYTIRATWDYDNLVFESMLPDPSSKTPILMVKVSSHGFDYSHSASFLLFPKKGNITYEDALIINRDFRFNPKDTLLKILEITDDTITYEVQSLYFEDNKSHTDTIHRGETKRYKDERDCTATIYDEDYDYTSGEEQIIICN